MKYSLLLISAANAVKLAVLEAIKEHPFVSVETLTGRAVAVDALVTTADIEEARKMVFPFIGVRDWFHETIVTGLEKKDSLNVILEALVARSLKDGKTLQDIDEEYMDKRMRSWIRYCIEQKECRQHESNPRVWVLSNAAIAQVVDDFIARASSTLAPTRQEHLKRSVLVAIKEAPFAEAKKILELARASEPRTTMEDVQFARKSVVPHMMERKWFYDLLRFRCSGKDALPHSELVKEVVQRGTELKYIQQGEVNELTVYEKIQNWCHFCIKNKQCRPLARDANVWVLTEPAIAVIIDRLFNAVETPVKKTTVDSIMLLDPVVVRVLKQRPVLPLAELVKKVHQTDPSISASAVQAVHAAFTPCVSVSGWFHEVLVAGSMTGASSEELFESVLRKGTALGAYKGSINEEGLKRQIQNWVRFCIEKNQCERYKNDPRLWVLTKPATDEIIDMVLSKLSSGGRRELSKDEKRELREIIADNAQVSPQFIADLFGITIDEAIREINTVLRIFIQPAWVVDMLSLYHESELSTRNEYILESLRVFNSGASNRRINGDVVDVLRAWIPSILKSKTSSEKNFVREKITVNGEEIEQVRMVPDAIERFLSEH